MKTIQLHRMCLWLQSLPFDMAYICIVIYMKCTTHGIFVYLCLKHRTSALCYFRHDHVSESTRFVLITPLTVFLHQYCKFQEWRAHYFYLLMYIWCFICYRCLVGRNSSWPLQTTAWFPASCPESPWEAQSNRGCAQISTTLPCDLRLFACTEKNPSGIWDVLVL